MAITASVQYDSNRGDESSIFLKNQEAEPGMEYRRAPYKASVFSIIEKATKQRAVRRKFNKTELESVERERVEAGRIVADMSAIMAATGNANFGGTMTSKDVHSRNDDHSRGQTTRQTKIVADATPDAGEASKLTVQGKTLPQPHPAWTQALVWNLDQMRESFDAPMWAERGVQRLPSRQGYAPGQRIRMNIRNTDIDSR